MTPVEEDKLIVERLFVGEGCARNEHGAGVPGIEYNARVGLILKIGPLIREIIASDEDLFSVEREAMYGDTLKATSVGRNFVRYIGKDYFEVADDQDYRLNPYFEVFCSCVNRYGLRKVIGRIENVWGSLVEEAVKILNSCVEDIRREIKSSSFKARLKSYRRSVVENYRELNLYVNDLFKFHARMLVLRVDLSYLESFRGAGGVTVMDVCQHRSRLLKDLKANVFGPLLGYAWKFEKGKRKGLHYHLLLFFDGGKVRQDVTLARMIGEHWHSVVTDRRGTYYNCNAFKEGYEYCGIGMVGYADQRAREGLRRIVIYMTKLDEYFKLSVPGVRCFGKGIRPKAFEVRRGRPRRSGLLLPSVNGY
ncbi:YagK/YfjJ domain-containing protein [Pseudomonas qingdaonensis]|uniref:YagK/YfjJ domain-containing protein n=1 Tax=Pseudomonas qingdaonensis TaxID=2056231 RepID=UPI0028AB30F5|nr:inovirus-type Gp2 protein [Pseudomonas qingdaonensis]